MAEGEISELSQRLKGDTKEKPIGFELRARP
jgi:hypothetical protein